MNISVKARMSAVVSFIIIASALAFFLSRHSRNHPEPVKAAVPSAVTTSQSRSVPKQYRSAEDIRKEYGRLEVVTLRGGRRLEGVVITTSDMYVMVTVNGTETFPMNEVEAREIVR